MRTDTEEETAAVAEDLKRALARKESAKTNEEKLLAAKSVEDAKARQKTVDICIFNFPCEFNDDFYYNRTK